MHYGKTIIVETTPNTRIRVVQLSGAGPLFGAERWVLALAKHLDRRKIASTVVVIKDEPGQDTALCHAAAKLGLDTRVVTSYGRLSFSAIGKLRKLLADKQAHILHTHGYKQDIIGRCATLAGPCRIVATLHGWSTLAGTKLKLYETLNRLLLPTFDAVVPLSTDLRAGVAKIPLLRRRLHLITNGVDVSEIDGHDALAMELASWRDTDIFVVGTIGQLIARKGLDTLLKAMARIGDDTWRLVLVGSGDQKQVLQRQAEDLGLAEKVVFFGYRPDRLAFLRGFDVFVLPSRLEGVPRCLMEAMAAEIPIIASDIPGCRDLIEDGVSGLLFGVDDDRHLARQLMRLRRQRTLRSSLARAARAVVREQHSAERMARHYENLFATLSGRVAGCLGSG